MKCISRLLYLNMYICRCDFVQTVKCFLDTLWIISKNSGERDHPILHKMVELMQGEELNTSWNSCDNIISQLYYFMLKVYVYSFSMLVGREIHVYLRHPVVFCQLQSFCENYRLYFHTSIDCEGRFINENCIELCVHYGKNGTLWRQTLLSKALCFGWMSGIDRMAVSLSFSPFGLKYGVRGHPIWNVWLQSFQIANFHIYVSSQPPDQPKVTHSD